MSLGGDPFAPLSEGEVDQAAPQAKRADKVPILPVPDDAPEMKFKHPEYGPPVLVWAYRDEAGRLLGYDARFERQVGGALQKAVLPLAYCQVGEKQGWRQKMLPVSRPLYGLDRLAQRPDAPVVVAEGAKSADAAGELLPDHVAVSWQGGSNAISLSNWQVLAGRDVLVWPDRDRQRELDGSERPYEDQPGNIAASNIIAHLKNIAARLRVLGLADWDCADGWDAADALADGWTPSRAASFVEEKAAETDGHAPGTVMPFNYEDGADGLYFRESETKRHRLCGRLKVLAKTRDPVGGSWGLLLEWRDDDGRSHRWAMPKAMLAGDGSSIREALLERGLYVSTDSKARGWLLSFLVSVDTSLRARAVSKVGWAGPAFALPHLTIGDTPSERVIFQQNDGGVHQYETAGTLEEWQQQVAKLAIGNSRLIMMISAAFVGPVLLPACEEGGGINVVGSSSTGKSTGMRAAASVWGPPSFVRQWRATSNGLEGVATQHSETLLCLDELSQVEPREAGAIAYMLGNGQGKARATRNGGGRTSASWKLMYLSTGEVGLGEIMREGRNARTPMAGQEVRILDVPADAGRGMGLFESIHGAASPEAFARQITSAATTYYGTASIEYLTRLAGIRDDIGDAIAGTIARFTAEFVPDGADGQVLRGARKFGLIAAAGELAIALGILPWPRDESFRACGVMFKAWIARRGGKGSAEVRNIIAQVRAFLEAHGESRFTAIDADERDRVVINRAGFWRQTLNADGESVREYLIMPETFKSEVIRGQDLTFATTALIGIGALKRGGDGRDTQKPRLPGVGSKRVYVIGSEIFDAE